MWKYVAGHLERRGFDVVLVGGAVVSIYSEGAYQSGDLDFIVNSFNKKELPKALAEIGFVKTPQRYFKHPECDHLFIEFPKGPTDSVIDRLEQFFVDEYGKPHGERKLFEQAVLIAKNQPVNWKKIDEFFKKHQPDMAKEFKEAVK